MSELPVYVTGGEFLVWDAGVVINLRQNHRIIGNCVGSLPWKPRQVLQGSLPIRLSRIEAAFLVKRKVVVLKQGNAFNEDDFTLERKEATEQKRAMQRTAQKVVLQKQKALELETLATTIMEGITKKDSIEAQDDVTSMDYEKFDILKKSEVQKSASKLNEQLWLDIPIRSTSQNNCPNLRNYHFNLSDKELLMYEVFCDLHNQGFYMTNALKFGGDFLVYPSDPVAYHSFYIAICVPNDKKLLGMEYARYGRLANSVRKTLLLCSKNTNGDIEYLSVSWTGIAQSDEKKS